MADIPPARSRTTRALAAGLFGLAMAELLTAIVCALVSGISFSGLIGTFTVTNGAMGLAFPVCGVLLAWQPGVGLISMYERAAELGGSCQAGPHPGGGLVIALLPLDRNVAELSAL